MTLTRDATAADLPAIDAIFRQSFCDTFAHLYSEENLRTFLNNFTPDAWREEFDDPRYRFRVAEVGREPIAFVKLGPSALPIDTDKRAVELRQLYVLKAHHGSGIAAELTDWALATARSGGFEEIYLTVFTDNHRARRFYERYGFDYIAPYAFMVGDHEDEDIIMRLVL
jgi:ribosomal protein S18 acetylase RimI-like enzyme